MGDQLTLDRGDRFSIEIAATAPLYEGARAEAFWNGERIEAAPLVGGRARFERFAATNGYLRLHVLAASGAPLAITNPIWIRMTAR